MYQDYVELKKNTHTHIKFHQLKGKETIKKNQQKKEKQKL